jgi:hypothetical protein
MPNQRGRYYLSRVIKLGGATQETMISQILNPPVRNIGKYAWSITDAEDGRKKTPAFIFGKLTKYSSEGRVNVVDPAKRSQVEAPAPNLIVASSPFVYLPEYSGLAFLHVWNGIQEDLFPKRFASLIDNVSVEPIADYRAFVEKLEGLERITEMSVKVHPPNPLFGHLWGPLKKYIEKRNAEEVTIKEKKITGDGLHTQLTGSMQRVLSQATEGQPSLVGLTEEPDITDAAILMAADGYGNGKIVGEEKGEEVVIRTSDTHKSFLFSKEPEPLKLAQTAASNFKKISKERRMKH